MQVDLDPSVACWTNPSGTLKGVGPGTELDWYVQRLHAADPGVVKVDLCKQMLGPEGDVASCLFLQINKNKQIKEELIISFIVFLPL